MPEIFKKVIFATSEPFQIVVLYIKREVYMMDDTLLQQYFEGKTSDEQSRLVTEWLDEDEANLRHYQQICRFYEISLWDEPVKRRTEKKTVIWRKIIMETLKIAAFFAFGFWLNQQLNMRSEEVGMQIVQVPPGQNSQVTLADGSKVWLNAGSSLRFPTRFSDKERLVSLEGEGYFEVQANKEKPFIVSTAGYQVKALGTTFNIYAYDKSPKFETSLLTGKVEISDHDKKQTVTLSPNNRAALINGKLKTLPIQDMDHFLWRKGMICFNEPLEDVFAKLELYFDVKIKVNNKNIGKDKRQCVAKFRARDGLEHILNVLQLTNHFSYTKDDDKNMVVIN